MDSTLYGKRQYSTLDGLYDSSLDRFSSRSTRTFFLRRFRTFFGTDVQWQIILGGVLLHTSFHTSTESAEEYRKLNFRTVFPHPAQFTARQQIPIQASVFGIRVQFQDMCVAIQTAISLLYSSHNTGIMMYPSDGDHTNSETSLLASL